MSVKNGKILGGLCALIFLCSQNVIAGDNEYLSLLEAEAAGSRIDSGERSNKPVSEKKRVYKVVINANQKDWSGKCGSVENVLPLNIRRQDFFSYLEQCSMTTFSLYRKLDDNSKRSIYEYYSSSSPLKVDRLRTEILKIYSKVDV